MSGKYWQEFGKRAVVLWMCVTLGLTIMGCSQPISGSKVDAPIALAINSKPQLEEVSPPEAIQQLSIELDQYEPQVKILGIESDETVTDTTVNLRLQVKDFPIYKDTKLGLGPHIHVLLDNQPYQTLYNVSEALIFKDLSPGTHTVRAFAVRPWDESFKTADASDQVTFHVFAPTQANRPDPTQPLLTYNNPQGEYGAEPIMLDYSVTLPKSKVGQTTSIAPWTVNVSLNGQSFKTSEGGPIYLKGFKPGVNWLKLELLNANGKPIANAFSETVRLITFNPNGKDTLSQLVKGELTAQEAERIVNRRISKRLTEQDKAAQEDQDEQEALAADAAAKRASARPAVLPEVPIKNSTDVAPEPVPITSRSPNQSFNQKVSDESSSKKTSARALPINTPIIQSSPTPVPSLEETPESTEAEHIQPRPSQTPAKQDVPLWSKLKSSLFSAKSDSAKSDSAKSGQVAPALQPNAARPIPSQESVSAGDPSANAKSSEPLQKLLEFQTLDLEKLPVIRPDAAVEVPSRYLKKSQPLNRTPEPTTEATTVED